MFSIYHNGRTISPFFKHETIKSLLNHVIEIGRTPFTLDALLLFALPLLLTLAKFAEDTEITQ